MEQGAVIFIYLPFFPCCKANHPRFLVKPKNENKELGDQYTVYLPNLGKIQPSKTPGDSDIGKEGAAGSLL